mgnify:CR=1 FL=1|jgi:CheY-like chemotaxis protein
MEQVPVVLIIEDDELLRGMVEDAISEAGFQFLTVAAGEEALTLLQSGVTDCKALITDINLKGSMNGWEVARQARQRDPGLAIVYMTGAAADEWPAEGVPDSILLQKPFAPAQLITAVSQLLNKSTLSS